MKITSTSKVLAAVVGFTMALTVFAAVGASTASAQAMSLSQLVDLFISLGIISPDKAAAAKAAVTSSATAMTFSKDLTVGSSGADVTALQNAIGVSPATGYFGSVTKAAVVAYQKAHGISGTGYVGPLTRAALNGSSSMTTTTTTGGTTTVVNSGVEGTLTVDKASISNSTVYEGESMHAVIGIKLQAKLSDINIQRVKLNLGDSTAIYTKTFKTMYVVDDSGRVLAQADLNSNTVVKDSGNYYLTLGGFSYNVPKDSTKYIWIKADVYASVKASTASNCAGTGASCSISVPADGIRGTDGAGLDQYGPVTSFSQSLTLSTSLVDSASLDLSVNAVNYKTTDVVATGGSNNDELDGLPLLAFDLRANKDTIKVTDVTVNISDTTNYATTTTAYLYDGSTLIQSESVSGGVATFNDIDNLYVSKDATKTLTVKVDVRSAATTANTFSVSSVSVTAENSQGTSVTASGSASGENMVVRSVGPIFTFSSPTMTRTALSSNDTSGIATSTGSASFTLNVTAKGADITFGSAASTTNLFGASNSATTTTGYLAVYKNGALQSSALSAITGGGTSAIVSYTVPSSGVTTSGESFTLSKNNSVSIPVTVQFTIAGSSANSYAIQVQKIAWQASGAQESSFMTNKSEWRTPAVSLP